MIIFLLHLESNDGDKFIIFSFSGIFLLCTICRPLLCSISGGWKYLDCGGLGCVDDANSNAILGTHVHPCAFNRLRMRFCDRIHVELWIDCSISAAFKFDPLVRAKLVRKYYTARYDILINHASQGVFRSALHTNIPHMFAILAQPDNPQRVLLSAFYTGSSKLLSSPPSFSSPFNIRLRLYFHRSEK